MPVVEVFDLYKDRGDLHLGQRGHDVDCRTVGPPRAAFDRAATATSEREGAPRDGCSRRMKNWQPRSGNGEAVVKKLVAARAVVRRQRRRARFDRRVHECRPKGPQPLLLGDEQLVFRLVLADGSRVPEGAAHVAPDGGVPVGALRRAAGARALVRVGDDDLQAPDLGVRPGRRVVVLVTLVVLPGGRLAAARARASSDGGDARAGVASSMAGMAGEKMGVAGLASQVDGEARVLGVASVASAARGASSPSDDDESSMDEPSTRAARAAVSSGDGIGPRGDGSGDDDASESEGGAVDRRRGAAAARRTPAPTRASGRRASRDLGRVARRRRGERRRRCPRAAGPGPRASSRSSTPRTSGEVDAVVDAVEARNEGPARGEAKATGDGRAGGGDGSWQTGATSSPSLASARGGGRPKAAKAPATGLAATAASAAARSRGARRRRARSRTRRRRSARSGAACRPRARRRPAAPRRRRGRRTRSARSGPAAPLRAPAARRSLSSSSSGRAPPPRP